MRFGHIGLNSTLKIIGKHETGFCEQCNTIEWLNRTCHY